MQRQTVPFSTQSPTPMAPHAYAPGSHDWKFRIIEMAVQRDSRIGKMSLHTLRAQYYRIFTRIDAHGNVVPAF